VDLVRSAEVSRDFAWRAGRSCGGRPSLQEADLLRQIVKLGAHSMHKPHERRHDLADRRGILLCGLRQAFGSFGGADIDNPLFVLKGDGIL
jgi:hypothetical protein